MKCPNCRCVVPDSMQVCSYCGYEFSEGTAKTLSVEEAYYDRVRYYDYDKNEYADNYCGIYNDYCGSYLGNNYGDGYYRTNIDCEASGCSQRLYGCNYYGNNLHFANADDYYGDGYNNRYYGGVKPQPVKNRKFYENYETALLVFAGINIFLLMLILELLLLLL